MKKLFLTIAVFTALVIIGCQENSITDPLQSGSQSNVTDANLKSGSSTEYFKGSIKLNQLLVDPSNQSEQIENHLAISGVVLFEGRLVYADPILPAPQQYIALQLSLSAEITDPNADSDAFSTVSGESNDVIDFEIVSNDGVTYINKYYTIQGTYSGLRLVCRFVVKTDGVDLSTVWLEQVDSNSDSDDHQTNQASLSGDDNTYPPVVRNLDHTN